MTTTSKSDYLSILGLSGNFDDSDLKKAFRREARRWHPDLNKNDINAEERFKLINEAYAILSDPKKRKEWEKLNNKIQDIFENRFPTFEEYLDVVLGIKRNLKSENDDINYQGYLIDHDERNLFCFLVLLEIRMLH